MVLFGIKQSVDREALRIYDQNVFDHLDVGTRATYYCLG